jgi:serine protease AprX
MTTTTHSLRPIGWPLLVVVLTALFASGASAQSLPDRLEKLDDALRERAHRLTGRSRVIVQFANSPDVRVITGHRGRAGRRLPREHAQVADLDNHMLSALAADPRVTRVVLDRPVFPTLERTRAAVGASLVREELKMTGAGIGIAVIDSGVTAWHDDLDRHFAGRTGSRVVHFRDFTRESNPGVWIPEVPSDPFGHGTHVAGTIAGSGYHSHSARVGTAPRSHLIGLQVLDGDGHGYVSNVIAAIDYAIAIRSAYNIRIINLSVGSGVLESYWHDPLTLAAKRAVEAGIVVVAAAGNLGQNAEGNVQFGGITSPGNAPWVLTVGASSHQGTARRQDDIVGAFSSRGPTWIDFAAKPDLVAPGVGIESLSDPHSALYAALPDYLIDGTRRSWYRPYLSLSGTSMAAPVVSGTVALMLEANPALTPNAVKAILQYTAQVRPVEHPLTQGAGLLNAAGAVRLARFFAAPMSGLGDMHDTIEGESIEWARHVFWGNHRISGGVLLPGSNAWAVHQVWGSPVTSAGEPVVWGAAHDRNIVWSTRGSDNIVWSTRGSDNIVWSTGGTENIVWSTRGSDNIVWSTRGADNIVWSTRGADNIVWSTRGADNIVWSTRGADNIVWSTRGADNIVWSTRGADNIVWSTRGADNIVWSTRGTDNIVWSTGVFENVVWGNACGGANCRRTIWSASVDGVVPGAPGSSVNTVWSTARSDNIVWSTAMNIVWSTAVSDNIVWSTGTQEPVLWPTSNLRRGGIAAQERGTP